MKFGYTSFVLSYLFNSMFSTYCLYLIYGWKTNQWQNGWIFVLSLVIGYQYSFYYFVPEHFGYSMAIFLYLCYLHIFSRTRNWYWYIFSILSGSLIAGSHLYTLLIMLIGLFYYFILDLSIDRRKIVFFHFIIFITTFATIKVIIPSSGYEMGRFHILYDNLKNYAVLDNSAFRYVFSRDQIIALDFHAIILAIILLVLARRKFVHGLLTLGVYYLTYYLNCLYSFNWQGTEYMELYGRLIFFGLLVSLIVLSFKYKVNQLFFWILCIVCFTSFIDKTHQVKEKYTERYKAIYQLTLRNKYDKSYFQTDTSMIDKIWFTWALPHESLLITTLEGHSKSVYVYNGSNLTFREAQSSHFNGSLRKFNREDLRNTYFKSLDTFEYQFQEK